MLAARGGADAVVWSVGLAKRWSGAVGLARWAGTRGGGAAGDAGMGRVLVRLLVALGLMAGWGESDRERECERDRESETENVKVKERKRQNGVMLKE